MRSHSMVHLKIELIKKTELFLWLSLMLMWSSESLSDDHQKVCLMITPLLLFQLLIWITIGGSRHGSCPGGGCALNSRLGLIQYRGLCGDLGMTSPPIVIQMQVLETTKSCFQSFISKLELPNIIDNSAVQANGMKKSCQMQSSHSFPQMAWNSHSGDSNFGL